MSFSSQYIKLFMQALTPYGYKKWKSVFYNIESDDICYVIRGHQRVLNKRYSSRIIELYISCLPYCADLKTNEYNPQENRGYTYVQWIKKLAPEKFTETYFKERIDVSDRENIHRGLQLICDDLQSIILPYISRFSDVEYLYNEIPGLLGSTNEENHLFSMEYYSLSIKLHKCNNALPYIDNLLTQKKNLLATVQSDLDELRKGTVSVAFKPLALTHEEISQLKKREPTFMKSHIERCEFVAKELENTIRRILEIREALSENDYIYLDRYIKETEKCSREYIKQIFLN